MKPTSIFSKMHFIFGLMAIFSTSHSAEQDIAQFLGEAKQAFASQQSVRDVMQFEVPNEQHIEIYGTDDKFVGLNISADQNATNSGMRSEVSVYYPFEAGDTLEYAWRMKMPDDFQSDAPRNRWWSMAQWHDQPNRDLGETWDNFPSHSPPIAFYYGVWEGEDVLAVEYLDQRSTLADLIYISRERWLNLRAEIKWSQGDDGYLKIYVDDQPTPQIYRQGPNMYNNYQHYLKLGMYRHSQISSDNWFFIDNLTITSFE